MNTENISEFLLEHAKWILSGIGVPYIEKLFGKKSENDRITINIENLSIGQLFVGLGKEKEIKSQFDELVEFLKNEGRAKIIDKIGADFSKPITDFIDGLESSVELEIEKIVDISRKISELKIIEDEKLPNERTVKDVSNSIQESPKKLKENLFGKLAKEFIKKKNQYLNEIAEKKLEEQNIGGIIFFLQTNIQFNSNEIVTPELLGFERIEDDNALVNLAMSGKIEIQEIKLINGDGNNNHKVFLKIKNLTDNPIICRIPKGQVIENKDFTDESQNLAISEFHDEVYIDDIWEDTLDAYCLNQSKKVPRGQVGNMAIYQVKDKRFSSGDELWEQLQDLSEKVFK